MALSTISSASPIRGDGTIDLSVRDQIKQIFGIKKYTRLLFLVGLYTLPTSMLQVFLVPFGAAWFGGCDVNANNEDTECKFDYDSYIFWDSLSLTAMGFVSFIFSGFLGRASDSFGRKIFLLLTFFVGLLNRGVMVFTDHLWLFFGLRALYGINGGRDAQTPVMNAYYADVLPPHLKTLGFGLSYAMAGIMLFVGAAIATTISLAFRTDLNWTAIAMVYVLAILYCMFFVEESLPTRNRKRFSCKNFNPIRPLLHVADNRIVLLVAIIQFLISLPQAGIIGIILVYFSDSLQIHNDTQSTIINAIFLVSMGVSGIICTGIVLPILKRNFKDLVIAEIGICGSIISQLIFASFYYVPRIPVIVAGALLYFCVGISNAAIFAILTKSLSVKEQGQGFGIVQSYRAITTIIAPFAFASGYRNSKKIGVPSLPFVVSSLIISSSLFVTRGALKKQLKIQPSRYRRSTIDSDMDTFINDEQDEFDYGSYYESGYHGKTERSIKETSMVAAPSHGSYSFNK
eukprot:523078_1